MRRYIIIGDNKKTINTNFKDKSPYILNLYKKQREIKEKIGIEKAEIICEKMFKKEIFQRNYSFFALNKPKIIETTKLPKINLSSQLKYSIITPEEKYINKPKKEDMFADIYKKNNLKFPRSIKKYKSNNKESKSYLYLPHIH